MEVFTLQQLVVSATERVFFAEPSRFPFESIPLVKMLMGSGYIPGKEKKSSFMRHSQIRRDILGAQQWPEIKPCFSN